MNILRYINRNVRKVIPPMSSGHKTRINLGLNELPFTFPDKVIQRINARIRTIKINRYPSTDHTEELINLIARQAGITNKNILLGVGAGELIQGLCMAVGNQGDAILVPIPSFIMLKQHVLVSNKRWVPMALNEDNQIDIDRLQKAVNRYKPKMIILTNPNNPTGNIVSEKVFDYLFSQFRGIVCVDEAYYDFCGKTYIQKIPLVPNLVVIRTFSKIGLAGIRVGYLAAQEPFLNQMRRVILPNNINSLSLVAAIEILKEEEIIHSYIEVIKKERDRVFGELSRYPELRIFPSEANFLLCQFPSRPNLLYDYLLHVSSISVCRNFNHPRLEKCLRFTIGNTHENEELLTSIHGFHSENKGFC